MMKVCLLDPGISDNQQSPSTNLGDLIIQNSIEREINDIFQNHELVKFSTHIRPNYIELQEISNSDTILVGGTNLLSSYMDDYRQWKIHLPEAFKIKKAILFGVGWWQYQKNTNIYTKILLNFALHKKIKHSVRDQYTLRQLKTAGISNVINTGCPTMWPLANMTPKDFSTQKSDNALLMLTDYNKDFELDSKLVQILLNNYRSVYFWPQGSGDLEYAKEMNLPLNFLEHSYKSFQDFLKSNIHFDYIGTRLHGGIYCLRSKRRSLIIEIDNRAKEISKETGIPTVQRNDFNYIQKWINGCSAPKITIDLKSIEKWKSQFQSIYQSS